VPRLINRICDRALYHGYLRRAAAIDHEVLEAAVPDAAQLAQAPPPAPRRDAGVPPHDPINAWTDGVDRAIEAAIPTPVQIAPVAAPRAASVTPSATAATPAAPAAPTAQDSHDPIVDWLLYAQGKAGAPPLAPSANPSPRAAEVVGPAPSKPMATAAVPDRKHAAPIRAEYKPRTHMQRTTSRWGRRLGVAALWLMGIAGAGIGAASIWTLSTELAAPIERPAPPPERPPTMAPLLFVPEMPDLFLDVPPAVRRNGSGVVALP
jgi:hypothetical protein